MRSTTTEMRLALSASPCMVESVAPASSTALRATCAEFTTCRPISAIDVDNSSVPADTLCTLLEVCSAAAAAAPTSAFERSAVADMPCAVASMELADRCRLSSALRTVASNSAIRASMRAAFRFAGAVLVLLGGQRARLDHARAEDLQRVGHDRDFIPLLGAIDLGLK